jgi:hypothetical protein
VPWLRVAVVVIGLVAVDGLSAGRRFPASRMGRRLGIVVAGAGGSVVSLPHVALPPWLRYG